MALQGGGYDHVGRVFCHEPVAKLALDAVRHIPGDRDDDRAIVFVHHQTPRHLDPNQLPVLSDHLHQVSDGRAGRLDR